MDPEEPLPATVKSRKLAWFRHVTRHDSPSKTNLPSTLGYGRWGRQRKSWLDTVKECTPLNTPDLLAPATHRKEWKSWPDTVKE